MLFSWNRTLFLVLLIVVVDDNDDGSDSDVDGSFMAKNRWYAAAARVESQDNLVAADFITV